MKSYLQSSKKLKLLNGDVIPLYYLFSSKHLFKKLFIPSQVDKVNMWLDGQDPNSLIQSGGQLVSWDSKVGNANMSVGGTQLDVITLNDFYGIQYNYNRYGDYNNRVNFRGYFCVVEHTQSTFPSSASDSFVFTSSSTSFWEGGNGIYASSSADLIFRFSEITEIFLPPFTSTDLASNFSITFDTFKIVYCVFPYGGIQDSDYDRIGRDRTSYEFRGKLFELITFDDVLTTYEYESILAYLINKYGFNADFTPNTINDLSLWLDGSDAKTLYDSTSGGSLVVPDGSIARWEDKSGNGFHVTQSTGGERPLRKQSVKNNLDVVRFDGLNDNLSRSAVLSGSSFTVFIVYSVILGSGLSKFVFMTGNSSSSGYAYVINPSDIRQINYSGVGAWSNGAAVTSWEVSSIVRDSSVNSGFPNLYIDGVLKTLSTPGSTSYNSPVGSTVVGATQAETALFHGDIAEIIVYNRALLEVERKKVEDYLMNKWGIS